MEDFTATSIWRKKEEGTIRFWQKGTHAAGSGNPSKGKEIIVYSDGLVVPDIDVEKTPKLKK